MKKLICSLASLLLVLSAPGQLMIPAPAPLHVVQTATAAGPGVPMATGFPSAPATGDLLVAFIGYYSSDSVAPPAGWTILKQQYANGAGGTTGFTSFYHVVAAGEGNSFTFNQGGNTATLALYDIAGADPYHPINGMSSNAQVTTAPSVTAPSVVPSVIGTLPLAAVADEATQPTGTLNPNWKYTPSAYTHHPVGAAYGPLSTDISTPIAAQFSLSANDFYGVASLTVLINPAGTTGHTPMATPGGPYSGVTSFAVNFDASGSIDPRFETLTYNWNFGDHSTGTGVRPSHLYTTAGTYTVALTVTDVDGNTASASTTTVIGQDCSSVTLGNFGALNNFVPSPADAWHQDISGATVDPMSDTILVTNRYDLAGSFLHPDFGGNGAYGIPYTVVDSSVTTPVPVNVTEYPDESDVAFFPIPAGMPVESAPTNCSGNGDNHAIVFDKHSCVVHEMYHTQSCSTAASKWSAGATTMWDLTQTQKRPYGITSVDAAGLSVFEGLIRYDEIVAGTINHAIRFTAQHTKNDSNNGYFTGPATHASGDYGTGIDNIEGMRIRLKANFDISGLSPQAKIIATAMKKYGMILADNGSNLFFQGTPDLNWNDDDLNHLKAIPASAFEVINQSLSPTYAVGSASLYPNGPIYDAVNHPTGAAPVISSFTASAQTIAPGQSVTLTPVVTGASYSYIDKVGFIRGPVTVSPTVTTTYTLVSRNAFDSAGATVTVTVNANTMSPAITFAAIPAKTYGAAPFLVAATSTSSAPIAYTVVSGPAGVAANIVTITGVGNVILQASQTATGNFTAGTVQASFTVNPAAPSLVLNPVADQTYGAVPFTVSSTSNSSGGSSYSVVSGPASMSGNLVALTGSGRVTLMVSQAAAGNYAAATATTSFNVAGEVPLLLFSPIPTQNDGAAPFLIYASSPSSGAITYSVAGGPATVSGNIVTLTGAGVVTLQASQAAAGPYAAAAATTSFTVIAPLTPVTLKFSTNTPAYLLPVSFTVNVGTGTGPAPTGWVGIVDGTTTIGVYSLKGTNGTLHGQITYALSLGQHLMTAIYSGDSNYHASRSAAVTITVGATPKKNKTQPPTKIAP